MPSEGEEPLPDDELDDEEEIEETTQKPGKSRKLLAKRRTKTGCLTCRKRRIKCGEERPICRNCVKSKRECAGYNPPLVYKNDQAGHEAAAIQVPRPSHGYPEYAVAANPHELDAHQHAAARLPYGNPYLQHDIGNPTYVQQTLCQNAPIENHVPVTEDHLAGHWPAPNNHYATAVGPDVDALNPQPSLFIQTDHPPLATPTFPYTPSYASGPLTAGSFSATSALPTSAIQNFDHTSPYSEHVVSQTPSLAGSVAPQVIDLNNQPPSYVAVATEHPAFFRPRNLSHTPTVDPVIHPTENVDPTTKSFPQKIQIPADSPLVDPECRRIFQNFVEFLGPCMSIFDRLDYGASHEAPRMAWTEGLPLMAFNHSALAHAIIAVSALQLSRIGQGDPGIALKHFTLALRQASFLLASDTNRHHVATLATILLLGYYEVIAGDHSRWSLHLSGAARLVMEHNYSAVFRTVRQMRAKAKVKLGQSWARDDSLHNYDLARIAGIPKNLLNDSDWSIDDTIVSRIMGMTVDYDAQVQWNFPRQLVVPDLNGSEVGTLHVVLSMYWWYCKQDTFQSMLSGDAPMLSYAKMKYCPPRGPIGRIDCVHATADHLWLILARMMTFGAKDRIRKLKVVESQGGEWIPAPGFLQLPTGMTGLGAMPKQSHPPDKDGSHRSATQKYRSHIPPTANEGRARKVKPAPDVMLGPAPAPIPMYGMIPPPIGPLQMSSSFDAMNAELRKANGDTPESTITESQHADFDLEAALAEHSAIARSLDLFRAALGPDFEPLNDQYVFTSPFGPSVRYSCPTVATLWAFYYLCLILLRRLHPHSPPAAMVSAGVNAFVTREPAQMIGRICCGLYDQHNILTQAGKPNYMFTAALMETTFALLFAGVQYQDPAQRSWTVTKLTNIAQQTGWASASAIAAACETTWERMGAAGKGPPYARKIDRGSADERVRGRTSVSGQAQAPTNLDAVAEHESRFVSHDRDLIDRHGSTRAHWALGVLSVEEDLRKMDLGAKGKLHAADNLR